LTHKQSNYITDTLFYYPTAKDGFNGKSIGKAFRILHLLLAIAHRT